MASSSPLNHLWVIESPAGWIRHISRGGDNYLRGLRYAAAIVILTRANADIHSSLKDWGNKLHEQLGFTRAAVAVARKLAAIMHTSSRQESHSTHRLAPRPNRGASLSSQRVSI